MALSTRNDVVVYQDEAGRAKASQVMVAVKSDGSGLGSKSLYQLLTAAIATGAWVGPIDGGDYAWRTEGTFNGATATLQYLGLDGVTPNNVRNAANTADIAVTANGGVSIGIAQGSFLRVAITGGPPANINSVIGGL